MACAPYPPAVRLGNVTLSNHMVARGMNMSIGSPPQAVAFMPMMPLNSTLLYGTNGYCQTGSPGPGPWTDAGCITFRGGAYDPLASTSKKSASVDAFPYDGTADPILGGAIYPQVQRVSDSLHVNDNLTIDGFPMGVAQSDWGEQGYTPMMGVGLGTNSTLLNFLVSTGKIASRSWSFFWGRVNIPGRRASTSSRQLDGSVVFGGYDRAKVIGNKFTQPMTTTEPGCPSQLIVNIADIVLNFANGSDASIFPKSSSATMAACLTPALPTLLWMPLDPYFSSFLNLTNNNIFSISRSVGIYYWNMRYADLSSFTEYDGDLTIKLQSGLSVRIANEQLVQPHTAIDQTTGRINVSTTNPDLLIDSLQNVQASNLAQIGWQFLSSAYLHVNQDTKEFTLWEANLTLDEDLVAVDEKGDEITNFCDPKSASSNTTNTGDGKETQAPVPGLSVGVIAGVSVGGVVLLGAIVGLLVWWLRRRRSRRDQTAAELARAESDHHMLDFAKSDYSSSDHDNAVACYKSELDGRDKRTPPPRQVLHEIYTRRESEMFKNRSPVEKYYQVKHDSHDTAAPAYEVRHELEA